MPEGSSRPSILGPIVAATIAAGGASGMTVYLSPATRIATDPLARPDAYTASMHNQYAETVDARFYAAGKTDTHLAERIARHERALEKEIERVRKEMADIKEERAFRREVLGSMNRILQQLIVNNGKH